MTTQHEADERRRLERARETRLFRYSLVQELIEPAPDGRRSGAGGPGSWPPCPIDGPGGQRVAGVVPDAEPVEAVLPGRRVRRAGAVPAAGQPRGPRGRCWRWRRR